MTSDGPTTSGIAAALAVSVVLLSGCGSDNDQHCARIQSANAGVDRGYAH